jgi:hypothetical protein
MFERGDNVMPVAAQSAMVAVMKHDDIAFRAAGTRDAREPRNQSLGRLRLPVPTNPRPHHHALHSRAANFTAKPWAPVPIGRTHPTRRISLDSSGNRDLALRQLVANPGARLKKQIRMRVRVIAKQMASRRNFLSQTRTFSHKFSNQKKSRAHGVAIKQIEKPRSDGWIGAIVKGESDPSGGIRVPYSGAE